VSAIDALTALQVGERTRNAQGTVLSARAHQVTLAGAGHYPLALRIQLEVSAQHRRVHLCVYEDALCSQSPRLTLACLDH
jgi:hypothetical protein